MLVLKKFANTFERTAINIFKLKYSTKARTFREVKVKVPWGYLCGKWWEPYDDRPIICIHGWQDNCGTFNRLIPMLNSNVGFLAIDLPGHGYSSRFPDGMLYSMFAYSLCINYIMENFGWSKISLLGHSMGGVIAFTHGLLSPIKTDYIICIENFLPSDMDNLANLENILEKFSKFNRIVFDSISEGPSYSWNELIQKQYQSSINYVFPEYAHHLLERNIAPSKLYEGKYVFTNDPRIKTLNIMQVNPETTFQRCRKDVNFPLLVIKGNHIGPFYSSKEYVENGLRLMNKINRYFEFHSLEGSHYLHLNTPENISNQIKEFIAKYNDFSLSNDMEK